MAADQAALDQKTATAHDWMLVKQGALSPAAFAAAHPAVAGLQPAGAAAMSADSTTLTSNALGVVQTPQYQSYACGEATAYEILKFLTITTGPGGESLSQPHLGAKCTKGYLCTETLAHKETPWSVGASYPDAGGYPMTSTLNTWGRTGWYTTQPGTGHDRTFTQAKYDSDLVLDIDIGYPTAIDVYKQANTGPHLTGHKTSINIEHWVAGYGYASTGATTKYADSVHGVSTTMISWAGGVPAYSSLPSTSFLP